MELGRILADVSRDEMIRNDIAKLVQPENGQRRQNPALVADRRRQHVIEGREAVSRDDHQIFAGRVDVANFAPGHQLYARQVGFKNGCQSLLVSRREQFFYCNFQVTPRCRVDNGYFTGLVASVLPIRAKEKNPMNWDTIEGNWKQVKGKAREQWGKLTDSDWDQVAGKKDQLVGRIQERYGISKDEAQRQADDAWRAD